MENNEITRALSSSRRPRASRIALLAALAAACTAFTPLAFGTAPAFAADRPPVMGPNAAVSAGDPLVTAAAIEILNAGGNAFDAGVAALMVGGIIEQDLYSLGGEALVLVYPRSENRVTSVVGQGWASKNATIEWYQSRGKDLAGEGLDPSVVPGALHAALTVLEKWGTMPFEKVAARAIQYADNGFPVRPRTLDAVKSNLEFFKKWPDNQKFWLKADGSMYKPGEVLKMPTLAATLKKMVDAERAAAGESREAGIAAARDRFYKGDIAQAMVAFLKTKDTPYELSDFAEYFARVEEPAKVSYRGYDVYKHSFGSQGPVLLETLNILENFDLQKMGQNSPDYVHTVVEAMKLGYADRDTYYGDPLFVKTPAEGLLSKGYAAERAKLIDPKVASRNFIAGNPLAYDSKVKTWPFWVANLKAGSPDGAPPPNAEPIRGTTTSKPINYVPPIPAAPEMLKATPISLTGKERLASDPGGFIKDTTHMAVIDKAGNIFDATPSGGWIGGAVVLGDTGIPMSVRGEQFWLNPNMAAQLRPRSRPRYTLTPSIVLKDGKPFMGLGTPGGDNQDQTILQAFLNVVEFWPKWYPNLHEAFEWPRVSTSHFHGSFWPHTAGLNKLTVEAPMGEAVINELKARGHDVTVGKPYSIGGCATAVMIDPATNMRLAGADPRRACYALAY
jgi:gamma-glutamyltranspeptidase/glutathione hydrolase